MIRDRLMDAAELVYGVLRAIVRSIDLTDMRLPHGEDVASLVLVVVVGGGFTALILHGIYDLTFGWFA